MSRHNSLFLPCLPLCFLALAIMLSITVPAYAENYTINARADRTRLTFEDGQPNRVIIQVSIRDAENKPVPDQTLVLFNTNLGAIISQAYTQNGQVNVPLENTDQPGWATVEIRIGSSRAQLQIEFVGPGGSKAYVPEPRVKYELTAKQCYYGVDRKVIDAIDHAKFSALHFTVTAPEIQFDAGSLVLVAQGNAEQAVVVTAGKRSFQARAVRIDIAREVGALREVDPEIHFKTFDLKKFEPVIDDKNALATQADYFKALSTTPTRTLIVSTRVTIYPGKQIQFRHAAFYLSGAQLCFLRLPYHVLFFNKDHSNTLFNADVTLNSGTGLYVDFPIYYAASDSHIGSIHLRNVNKGSMFYRGRAGIQVGIEEEYLVGIRGDGALYLDDVTQPTRSATWENSYDFGKLRTNINASYDRYSMDTPYSTRVSTAFSRPLGDFGVSLASSWNDYKGAQTGRTQLSTTIPNLKLGKTKLALAFNPYIGWNGSSTQATTTSEATTTSRLYEGLHASLLFPGYMFLGGSLYPSVGSEITHGSDGVTATYYDAGLRYGLRLFNHFSTGLNYSYTYSITTKQTSGRQSQQLGWDFSGTTKNWTMYSFASYSLSSKSIFAAGNWRVSLPFLKSSDGERRLFFNYGASLNKSPNMPMTTNHLFTLERSLGSYCLQLHYSPSGNNSIIGFGTGNGKNWAIEVVQTAW